MVSKHAKSAVAHVNADANANWDKIPISPDYERVPGASVVTGSPDASRKSMRVSPDCERVPGSHRCWLGDDVGSTRSRTHTRRRVSLDRETMLIPLDCERVPGTGDDADDPFFVRFELTMVFWLRFVSLKKGAGCDVPVDPLHAAKLDYVFGG